MAVWVTFKYVVINIGTQTILALSIAVMMDRLTKFNLIEFKSPKDAVSWGDYATLVGYAGQYAAGL